MLQVHDRQSLVAKCREQLGGAQARRLAALELHLAARGVGVLDVDDDEGAGPDSFRWEEGSVPSSQSLRGGSNTSTSSVSSSASARWGTLDGITSTSPARTISSCAPSSPIQNLSAPCRM